MRGIRVVSTLLLLWLFAVQAYAQCQQQSLRVAVIPKKGMDVLLHEYRPLLDQLSLKLSMPVEIVASSSYESVVDAIVSGGVDIAWLGPASYILAHGRDPRIEPFASLTIDGGYFTPPGHHYQALLLVRASEFDSLEALRGKTVALSDPVSTSGSLIPNAEFARLTGLPLAQFFGSVSYSGSHDKSLDALLGKRIDAVFVASVRADAYLREGRMQQDSLRVLWRSEPIYYDPYVFSGSLCDELKRAIGSVMLGDRAVLGDFLKSQGASGLAPVSHAEYAPLQQLMQGR